MQTSSPSRSTKRSDCICAVGYEAASNGLQCSACGLGRFKLNLGPGACTKCAESSYKGTTGIGECTQCPPNTGTWELAERIFPDDPDFVEIRGVSILSECICDAGYTSAFNGVECFMCPRGFYKTAIGIGACLPCPFGTSSDPGSAFLDSCRCLPGYEASTDGVACSLCNAGTFKSNTGTGLCSVCSGNFITGGTSECIQACKRHATWDNVLDNCICDQDYVLDSDTLECVVSESTKLLSAGSSCGCY
jgi:hypothetical protein